MEATGKFTFIGENVDCILNHPDFNALINETVLRTVGPLLQNKNGNPYHIKNGADKKYVLEIYSFYSFFRRNCKLYCILGKTPS